jgi:hypothetical protein
MKLSKTEVLSRITHLGMYSGGHDEVGLLVVLMNPTVEDINYNIEHHIYMYVAIHLISLKKNSVLLIAN